jgi:hypothetical protein
MRKNLRLLVALLLLSQTAHAAMSAKILQLTGEVKVRRGVEHEWEAAGRGMLLEEIDTIMTLERGAATLELGNGVTFRLGGNAILDISDLREITERELFLLLVSQKVGKLAPSSEKIELRLGVVSSVRSEDKGAKPPIARAMARTWQMETNAARALRGQNFLTNAALKLHNAKEKFPQRDDCGELSLELAQVFEALRQTGRAQDEYQAALADCGAAACEDALAQERKAVIAEALRRLR